MTRFIFPESEAIWRANASNRRSKRSNNYIPTTKKTIMAVVRNKTKRLHVNCRDCGDDLEGKASMYLGICPICDNK